MKAATSIVAVPRRISIRTSEGMEAIGHGGAGEPSIGGGTPVIGRESKDWMS